MKAKLCDKCGKPVEDPTNNAWLLGLRADVLAGKIPAEREGELMDRAINHRHLFRSGNGSDHCRGSPSLYQYLPDQPRDTRPEHAYDPAYAVFVQRAYWQLLRRADHTATADTDPPTEASN